MKDVSVQKTFIFTDLRHIRCSDLEWFSPDGNELPMASPEPQIEAYAKTCYVPHGVRLVAQQAQKSEPLPKGTRLRQVIFENGLYRSWYLDAIYPPGKDFGSYSEDLPLSVEICYVESKDGFEWTEPTRCKIKVPGQTAFDGFTFFIDPKGHFEERYKAIYTAIPPVSEWPALWEKYQQVHSRYRDRRLNVNYLYCMYGIVSPDGIHWKPIHEPLMVHKSDTDTTVYYDSWLGRYVMYTRLYWQERRWIARAETQDFHHWDHVEPLIWPGLDSSLADDIYTNCRTEYPEVSGYHLMFPMVYHRYSQTSEVRLFSSADGICWNQVPGGAVLLPGAPGEWDSEFISVSKNLVPLGNDRIALLYHGTSFPHKYPRWKTVLEAMRSAWVWWPKGRICAVVADEEGEFFTFPLVPAGKKLRLNVRTRHAGEIRVGINDKLHVDIPGRTVADCDPIHGDSLALTVHWKGQSDIRAKKGEGVTLHFKLRSAEVFGFEWV